MPKSAVSRRSEEATPLDGDDFLAANRRAREQLRAEEQRTADRVPRRLSDDDAARAGAARFRIAGSRRLFVLIALLVVAVVGLGTSTGVLAYRLAAEQPAAPADTDRVAVLDAAKRYASSLATYDPADYADLDRRIRAVSTPDFAKTYIQASADARAGNGNARGVSKATARYAGIESLEPGRAVVLVALDQRVTSPQIAEQVPDGVPYQSRVRVTLVHRDGRWQLDDLATV
ncbi:MAG: hypothetical protein QM662_09775 [Gordonia sp. (in: high G+C Gram-positive bacteria)]